MSQTITERRAVSVEELKRAWAAVQTGQFRPHTVRTPAAAERAATDPASAVGSGGVEPVLPVLGCGGSSGATTLAVALATAIGVPARVVECASRTLTGLAAAAAAELGASGSWIRGTRDQVVLERVGEVLTTLDEVPELLPADDGATATVLDVAWEMGQVLATPGWMATVVRAGNPVVLTATATIPGLRRLEVALDLLGEVPVVAAVRGPVPRRWPKAVRHSAGPLTRSLEREQRLVCTPLDSGLAVRGLTGDPLPRPLLDAAAQLLRLVPGITTKGTR
ncbi:hypothetical protein [Segeticoccus rhizosphaerae]|uniref:hypothetical protein n=1 Tax=Segeticoccus rhizosphaerae TaxID=1104777 RepID=UPI00126573D5|nr:hypothetical protein [Segeticoccus rhizosphaerae]